MTVSADQIIVRAAQRPRAGRWWRRPWVVPLAVVTLAFLAHAVPPYLTLDPAQARLAPLPPSPLFYPVLVLHILLGSIVLLTACLQVWPWLRRTHPAVHRWSGRLYVGCLVPAALAVIIIAPMTRFGPNQQVANTTLGVLWLLVTLAGFRAVRERRFGDHRRWMVRSVALSFSIVTNRFWSAVCVIVFAPETVDTTSTPALDQAVGVAAWLSWLVNLAIAEWWLQRPPGRRRVRPRSGSPDAELVS